MSATLRGLHYIVYTEHCDYGKAIFFHILVPLNDHKSVTSHF